MKQPDPKYHQQISFAKSAIRVLAGGVMIIASQRLQTNLVGFAGGLLIAAEILGILEELV